MSNTSKSIEKLANTFCKIGQSDKNKDLYLRSLEGLVRLAISEHNLSVDLDYAKCMSMLSVPK